MMMMMMMMMPQEVAGCLAVPPHQLAQLHSSFLLYSDKRSELTAQMQATMTQLQQLLAALTQQRDSADTVPGSSRAGSGDGAEGSEDAGGAAAADNAALGQTQPPYSDMFDVIEDADALLAQLSRQVWSLREVSRCLVFDVANTLDPLQMSRATVNSWPFLMQPPPIVEVLVAQHVAQQQQQQHEASEQQSHQQEPQ
jgi:hypothetical protein